MCIYDIQVLSERTIQNFKPTRLAIKRLAGQLYFCKSTKKDFITYVGSGVRWLKRIKKYGRKNVETLWVSDWYSCPHELQEIALHFSKENQIVESDKWANLKPENGLDGGMDDETRLRVNGCLERRKKQSIKMSGDENPAKRPESKSKLSVAMKKRWEDPIFRKNVSNAAKKQWEDAEFVEKTTSAVSKNLKQSWEDPVYRKSMIEKQTLKWEDPDYRESMSEKRTLKWEDPEYRDKITGKNHPKYDPTIYSFIHKNGAIETCTRFDLIQKYSLDSGSMSSLLANIRKTCSGWRLLLVTSD